MVCLHSTEGDSDLILTQYSEPAMLPATEWDKIVPQNRVFIRRNFLQVLSKGHPGAFRYLLATRNEQPIAAFVFQKVQLNGEDLKPYSGEHPEKSYSWPLSQTLVRFVRDRLHLLRWPILTSRSPLAAEESGFVFAPDLSAEDRNSLLSAAIREAAASFRGIRGYLISGNAPELNGFHRVPAEPDMVLHFPPEWQSFEDYINALQSKYRVRARRIQRQAADLLRVELDAAGIRKEQASWNELYRNVVAEAGFNLATLHQDYFFEMKLAFGEDFRFVAWYAPSEKGQSQRKPIGFHTALNRQEVTHAHFIGLDYQANTEFKLYPAMLYEYIQLALESGSRILHLGRTAPEIKSTVGAEPAANEYLFRHERPIIQSLIGQALQEARIPEWTMRKPFRQDEHLDDSSDVKDHSKAARGFSPLDRGPD